MGLDVDVVLSPKVGAAGSGPPATESGKQPLRTGGAAAAAAAPAPIHGQSVTCWLRTSSDPKPHRVWLGPCGAVLAAGLHELWWTSNGGGETGRKECV